MPINKQADQMKPILIHISAVVVSIVTFILAYGTILKGYDMASPWWMMQFPGTEPLFLPFLWSFKYLDPSLAAFIAGVTASIMNKSTRVSIIIGICLGCMYFWIFGYRTSSMLPHAFGTALVALAGFGGHFIGKKISRHNKEDAPDLKAIR
jgi:hypothetical protein